MDYARPPMTRWAAQLRDPEQERRFRRYNLPAQRRSALVALLVVVLGDLVIFASTALAAGEPVQLPRLIVQACVAVGGAVLAVQLFRHRRPRVLFRIVVAAVVFLSAAIAAIIATGPAMGFRGSILVVAGVVVIYLSAPLTLVGATWLALLYSALTVPVWLLATDAPTSADVRYVLVAVVLAHVLSFTEARRSQQERRVLFAQRESLHRLSKADPLTGVVNRRAFDEALARQWEAWRAGSASLSMLMIDIDHFKRLNDSFGHAAGDRALVAVAAAIGRTLPDGRCLLARYGGEEFACLLPGMDDAAAAALARRMLDEVRREAIETPGPAGMLTVSIGVAAARPGMTSPAALVDAADRMLYRAKQSGRDRLQAGGPVAAQPPTGTPAPGPASGSHATGPALGSPAADAGPGPYPAGAVSGSHATGSALGSHATGPALGRPVPGLSRPAPE